MLLLMLMLRCQCASSVAVSITRCIIRRLPLVRVLQRCVNHSRPHSHQRAAGRQGACTTAAKH